MYELGMHEIEKLRTVSRRISYLIIAGFLFVVASFGYSYLEFIKLEHAIADKVEQLAGLESDRNKLRQNVKESQKKAKRLQAQVKKLRATQQSLLDFLVTVTDAKKINILDSDVAWNEVKRQLDDLPAGKRKNAILHAILLAWKHIPFSMGQQSVPEGFDSPRFLRYVLKTVGIKIADKPNESLSITIMNRFKKVDDPKPGDLVFFKGQVGNFGLILVSVGQNFSEHVGIGTLQKSNPLQVIALRNINVPYFPLRGYYRVRYSDEQ